MNSSLDSLELIDMSEIEKRVTQSCVVYLESMIIEVVVFPEQNLDILSKSKIYGISDQISSHLHK